MEEEFFRKVKENEEKIQVFGPHVAGFVNFCCGLGLYPLFQMSAQLSMSSRPSPDYSGKKFKEKMYSYVFEHHAGNRPYQPAKHYNYTSALIHNSLQGPKAFYKGFSPSVLSFYLSILCRSATSALIPSGFLQNSQSNRVLAEIFLSSVIELALHPFFVIQTRLLNQNSKMKVFTGYKEIVQKCGFRSLWAGWGSVIPRQIVLALWAGNGLEIDRSLELVLGSSTMVQVFLREILVGAGGMLLVYPFLTLTRRVAACGPVVGMSRQGYKGIGQAFKHIVRNEGFGSLFRGFGLFLVATSAWILFMPTFTQLIWMKIGPSRDEFLSVFGND